MIICISLKLMYNVYRAFSVMNTITRKAVIDHNSSTDYLIIMHVIRSVRIV